MRGHRGPVLPGDGQQRVQPAPVRRDRVGVGPGEPGERGGHQDAVGLAAHPDRRYRAAPAHVPDEESAGGVEDGGTDDRVEHRPEVVPPGGRPQRDVHRSRFGLVGTVGTRYGRHHRGVDAEQFGQPLAVALRGRGGPRCRPGERGEPLRRLVDGPERRRGAAGVVRRRALRQQPEPGAAVGQVGLGRGRVAGPQPQHHEPVQPAAQGVGQRYPERHPDRHGGVEVHQPLQRRRDVQCRPGGPELVGIGRTGIRPHLQVGRYRLAGDGEDLLPVHVPQQLERVGQQPRPGRLGPRGRFRVGGRRLRQFQEGDDDVGVRPVAGTRFAGEAVRPLGADAGRAGRAHRPVQRTVGGPQRVRRPAGPVHRPPIGGRRVPAAGRRSPPRG